ncbi:unnamed protein product [Caenorhabditis angaria]|uniref:EF-hand domain-containing protein n=1 Tax=Caenorhabditis angaria TaxID=860376 RepID=A0A9P1J5H1_9PELO|nr:unnamed protein product [Caenorhabditis angaria]
MQSMAQQNGDLSDDNPHVKELKRLFISCTERNGFLDKNGLGILCNKLSLSEFAPSIIDRVLREDESINFKQFKDRFISFLPEIIDLTSGNIDEVLVAAYKTSSALGIKNTQRLTRYDVHAICENTSELDLLTLVEINAILEKSTNPNCVSLVEFIGHFRTRQKMSDEIHFIADSYRLSTINLFEPLDQNHTGEADSSSVIEYLTTAGLKLEEAIGLLKDYGDNNSSMIGLVGFGNYLEAAVSHFLNSSPTSTRAAVFCMKSLIENYRCNVREFEMRCEHMQKQIHIANQRRTMLIEELDQNQQSIEASYNNRIKEMEERCRARIALMEEKFHQERVEMQKEFENIEKDLSIVRHNETSLKNKIQLVERHNKRISLELEEQTEALNNSEKENRTLRASLRKNQQFRASDETAKIMIWKQKVETMVAHNKRLREKLHDMTKYSKNDRASDHESYVQWTTPFRSQLLLIRKRRSQKGDTLSEMDSEPESIFYRRRRKRLHKKRDRMRKYETIHNLLKAGKNETEEFSNNGFSETGRKSILSPRNRDMLISLKDSDNNSITSDRKLISRAKNDTGAFDELQHVHEYERKIQLLQSTLITQKNMYEGQILNLSKRYANRNDEPATPEPSSRFYSWLDKNRKKEGHAVTEVTNSNLGVEKSILHRQRSSQQQSSSVTYPPCAKCVMMEPKLYELNFLVGGAKSFAVEDPVPHSSMSQDKVYLQAECGRLKSRLNMARIKVSEVIAIVQLPTNRNILLTPSSNGEGRPYSSRTHRSFADLRERTPLSERSESSKDSVADPSQFTNNFQKQQLA